MSNKPPRRIRFVHDQQSAGSPAAVASEAGTLSPSDELDRQVAAIAAARAGEREGSRAMPHQPPPHSGATAAPPEESSGAPLPNPDDSIVYGSHQTVRVETTIYRAFVELEDGLVRAIPAGVQIAPTSMDHVIRRVQRAARISDAREDVRDQHALLQARRITGHLEVLQQDTPALPSPQDPVLPAAEAAPDAHGAAAPRVISLEDVVREPERFQPVDAQDPRVLRLLATRDAKAAPLPQAHGPWHSFKRGLHAVVYVVTFILAITAIMVIIPPTRPLVGLAGTWLYHYVAIPIMDRLSGKLPAVVPAVAGAPDEFAFKRSPSISCGQFVAIFNGTSLATEAPQVCAQVARQGYDPAILGGMAKITMSVTSTESLAEWAPAPTGRYNPFALMDGNGQIVTYGSYSEAFAAFTDVLNGYAQRNITSLPALITATCLAPACDANAFITNAQQLIRDLRATPDPAAGGATMSAGDTAQTPIAVQANKRILLMVTSITASPAGPGSTHVAGKVINISGDTLSIGANAFTFYDKAGVSYSTATGGQPPATLTPGRWTPFELTIPVPMDQPLKMQLVLPPDAPIVLELRK